MENAMEKRKLLIADSNEAFCTALEAVLQDEFCIQIAFGGNEAVALLEQFKPDVLVLDVMLSGLDGIRVLEYAARNGHKLKTLVATSVRSNYIFAKLTQLEVSYVLLKPCDLEITAERVRDISEDVTPVTAGNDEQKITEILLQLGVNPKHNGYHYLCTAVEFYAADNAQSLTKELYIAVGAVYGVGGQQVERSVRAAVEAAWKRRNEQVWQQWFSGLCSMKRPTNGEVICRLAEWLQSAKLRKIG